MKKNICIMFLMLVSFLLFAQKDPYISVLQATFCTAVSDIGDEIIDVTKDDTVIAYDTKHGTIALFTNNLALIEWIDTDTHTIRLLTRGMTAEAAKELISQKYLMKEYSEYSEQLKVKYMPEFLSDMTAKSSSIGYMFSNVDHMFTYLPKDKELIKFW